jgi:hypothetical protein
MSGKDLYLAKAAQLSARAAAETNSAARADFESIARAYLRLAEQSDGHSVIDILYATPPATHSNER